MDHSNFTVYFILLACALQSHVRSPGSISFTETNHLASTLRQTGRWHKNKIRPCAVVRTQVINRPLDLFFVLFTCCLLFCIVFRHFFNSTFSFGYLSYGFLQVCHGLWNYLIVSVWLQPSPQCQFWLCFDRSFWGVSKQKRFI